MIPSRNKFMAFIFILILSIKVLFTSCSFDAFDNGFLLLDPLFALSLVSFDFDAISTSCSCSCSGAVLGLKIC